MKDVYRLWFSNLFINKYVYRFWFYHQIDYQVCEPVYILPTNWLSSMCTGLHFTTKLIIKYVYRFWFSTKLIINYVYRFTFHHQINYQVFVPVLSLPPNWLSSMCTGFDFAPN
jgi:hypothetical protein